MNTILYTQNETATTPNTIMVDGVIYNDFTQQEAYKAFKYINQKSEKSGKWEWLIKQLHKQHVILSPNFKYVKDADGVFIRASFNEKDEGERNMAFMFFTKERKMSVVTNIIDQTASCIQRSVRGDEIRNFAKAIRKVQYIQYAVSLIILFILLWIL